MKYNHEFAIKHLPKFIVGTVLILIGCLFATVLTYNYITDNNTIANILFFFGGAIIYFVGGLMLSEGIEYSNKLELEPDPDSWEHRAKNERQKFIAAWKDKSIPTIEERREAVTNIDFSEVNKAIAKERKEIEKSELTSNVLDDE